MQRRSVMLAACTAAVAGVASSAAASIAFIAGADTPAGPHVRAFDATGAQVFSFLAYDAAFTGGVRVAGGDVNGDGRADVITGAGVGAPGGHVKVFSGSTGSQLRSFFPYAPGFTGGVSVAAGDIDGDGRADVITGAGAGAPGGHVKVFSGSTGAELRSFFAFDAFLGGVNVAGGDVDGDGRADIIAAAASGAGQVKVFSGADGSLINSFFAFDPTFTGGVTVATGDLDGDGLADIVTGAGAGSGGHVRVFSGADGSLLANFFAFDGFAGGVRVAVGDVNGDGLAEVGVTLADGPGEVRFFQPGGAGFAPLTPFGSGYSGGLFIAGVIPAPASATLLALGVLASTRRRRR